METHNHIFKYVKENKLPVELGEYDLVISEAKFLMCTCGIGKIQYNVDYYWLGISDTQEIFICPMYRKRFEKILSHSEIISNFNCN